MLRKCLIISLLLITYVGSYSQAPQMFNYQSIVRDESGGIIATQDIAIKISIIQGDISNNAIYSEIHNVTTNQFGLVNLKIGSVTPDLGIFEDIEWGTQSSYINIKVDKNGGTDFIEMGTSQLLSVPYALYAEKSGDSDSSIWKIESENAYFLNGKVGIGNANPVSKLEVKQEQVNPSEPLFEVINANNDTVFAVFPDGVKVYVNSTQKGNIGGFAVSGRSPMKDGNGVDRVDYLHVTPDSTRIYIPYGVSGKGNIGGFAVSGRSPTKATPVEYLRITNDSTRFFVDNSSKGNIGGFAVSGRSPTKSGGIPDFFNISGTGSANIINPSQARFMWYPLKEAILAGKVLIEHPDSVGFNSLMIGYESKAIGNNSQALGYKCVSKGITSTAIGRFSRSEGVNSFAFGNETKSQGEESFAVGRKTEARGNSCFAIGGSERDASGNTTGRITYADGVASLALGLGAQADGIANTAIGLLSTADGTFGSVAMGFGTHASGIRATAIGDSAIAIGKKALSIGINTIASGINSFALGINTEARAMNSFALGTYNNTEGPASPNLFVPNEPLFVIGNGCGIPGGFPSANGIIPERNNAFTILKNGNVGIGVDEPTSKLHVKDVLRLEPRSTPPNDATQGDMYFDKTTNKLRVYDGDVWQACW
ncbi:MAG: hypothetical protein U9R54_03950 [Bacteroidota bacterium]|nr:hypothetical protein [Bacteroidota bacterium]